MLPPSFFSSLLFLPVWIYPSSLLSLTYSISLISIFNRETATPRLDLERTTLLSTRATLSRCSTLKPRPTKELVVGEYCDVDEDGSMRNLPPPSPHFHLRPFSSLFLFLAAATGSCGLGKLKKPMIGLVSCIKKELKKCARMKFILIFLNLPSQMPSLFFV